ncbi:MAG: hypothetical protein AABY22_11165, partial [Nanoarchaeota archaeon]
MIKLSILTASVRPEGLDIVYQCLRKQDFDPKEFEWIIVGNTEVHEYLIHQPWEDHYVQDGDLFAFTLEGGFQIRALTEPSKRKGDFYNLTKSYNLLFNNANGELAVMWTDLTWAPSDVLSLFWQHYQNNPNICVGAIGHQYEKVEMNKPQIEIWHDPRARTDYGSFYEISPIDFEMCLASIPVQAVKDVGGWDEHWDMYAATGEKEI